MKQISVLKLLSLWYSVVVAQNKTAKNALHIFKWLKKSKEEYSFKDEIYKMSPQISIHRCTFHINFDGREGGKEGRKEGKEGGREGQREGERGEGREERREDVG